MTIKSIKCLLIICLILSIKDAFANADKTCEFRLIIDSGKNVQSVYPSARKVNNCDITIDKNIKLNPTHIFDIKDIKLFHELSLKYPGKFEKIIFEHIDEGFASLVNSQKELHQFMLSCTHMLKEGGIIVYESARHSSSVSDKYGNNIDLGIAHIIEGHYQALHKIYTEKTVTLPSKKFLFTKEIYEELFKLYGFNDISILIKEDTDYRLLHATKTPYYYLEIIIKTPSK